MSSVIEARELTRVYRSGRTRFRALKGLSLDVARATSTAILGSSGSGKSTLLRILAGLDKPTSGTVRVLGEDLQSMDEEQLTAFRRAHIGFVLQDYALLPMNAVENAAFPLMLRGVPERERMHRATDLLERMGLGRQLRHKPTQLSGGQQQRVSIARAVIAHPQIVLADEPTGSLDATNASEVMQLLLQLVREEDATLVFVTHDGLRAEEADRIVHLADGWIATEEQST